MNKLFDLTGRVALITGGSRGLGKEMAEGLAEAGAAVYILARRQQWLDPTLDELRTHGFHANGMVCDVSDPEQAQAAVSRCADVFGKIDILVNNAGITWAANAEDMPLDKWRRVIDTNLTGAFLFCHYVGRHMIGNRYGRIINIASINAVQGGLPMMEIPLVGYAASKGGLISLTRELAAEWGRHNIRVNGIAPGYFPTRMTEPLWAAAETFVRDRVPLGRAGAAGEIKGVAVFLAADASNYITGQTIIVDGGTTLV
ncbi:MAG TPA: glucose 1-dehydrogenase [Bryobacteraceae bacterium]|nr:glucose 1-dehydrogenase [Bryobacteraceae bacterium]